MAADRSVAETGSTNADLAAACQHGEAAGTVLITDYQSAGRGRQGRTWTAPPGTGIAMSVLVRPEGIDPARWTWLPLLAGLAVSDGIRRTADLPARAQVAQRRARRRAQGVRHSRRASRDAARPGLRGRASASTSTWPNDQLPVPTATSLAIAAASSAPRFPRVRR